MGKDKKKDKKRKHDSHSNNDSDDDRHDKKKSSKKAEKIASLLGYTNDINPFGDSNLFQPFTWTKKIEKEQIDGSKDNKKKSKSNGNDSSNDDDDEGKRIKLLKDIHKVRKRRDEREKELEEMERLRNEEQRLRDAANYGDWQDKEETFHLEQTRIRSKIRLVEKRVQPIDLLARSILLIETLAKSNNTSNDSSSSSKGKNYNDDIDDNMKELNFEIHDPVSIIDSLNASELEKLLEDIESYRQLEANHGGTYESFWAHLKILATSQVKDKMNEAISKGSSSDGIHMSIATEIKELLRNKSLSQLEALHVDINRNLQSTGPAAAGGSSDDKLYWERLSKEVTLQHSRLAVGAIHDELVKKQQELLKDVKHKKKETAGDDNDSDMDANKVTEETMDDEVRLAVSTYDWQEKYKPRKPRYLNRILTGWDWNKYNQTHYDHDNPPPKLIHGYRFTIFFPDLINPRQTPRYFIEPTDEKEFSIIRFHGGPPYEDVAFKIINKEWEINKYSGFKCLFDRGVLIVNFNFKRHFYRR